MLAAVDRAALRKMLAEYDLDHRAEAILALARPCAWLSAERGSGRSRIGGEPELPSDLPWPRMDDRELTFLAQIDLAEVAIDGLPREGLLAFFFERSGDYDGIDPCRVLHVRGATARRAIPSGLEAFEEHRLVATAGLSFPDFRPESPYLALVAESEDDRDALMDWSSIVDEDMGRVGSHQLLGYPKGYQRDTLLTAAKGFVASDPTTSRPTAAEEARRLRLLLQLGEEPGAGLHWFDGGNLSFVLRDDDLAAARFDHAWAVMELG